LILVYSPLPPMASQKSSGVSASLISLISREPFISVATVCATLTSPSLANSPSHSCVLPGVSSTKQSPLLSDAHFSSTCAALVFISSVPLIWKSEVPSVS